ncbi:hypothetical protein BGZ80_009979, partial [Entomortierella chlamydospora]
MSRDKMDSQSSAYLDILWINSALDRSPNAFFTAVNANNKQRAHKRYQQMIENCNLDSDDKKILLEKFETWKIDHAQQFWLDQRTQSSQMRVADVLVEGSEPYALQSIHRNVSRTHGDLATNRNASTSSHKNNSTSVVASSLDLPSVDVEAEQIDISVVEEDERDESAYSSNISPIPALSSTPTLTNTIRAVLSMLISK